MPSDKPPQNPTENNEPEQISLPIIKGDQFDFTEEDVAVALQNATKNLTEARESLEDPDERVREMAKRTLSFKEEKVRALSLPPQEVLERVRTFYDRTAELGKAGLDERSLVKQLVNEFPDLVSYYELLRKKAWGYRLGQAAMLAASKES